MRTSNVRICCGTGGISLRYRQQDRPSPTLVRALTCGNTVEVMRRYSRQADVWARTKRLEKLLDPKTRPHRTEPDPVPARVNRVDVRLGGDVIAQLVTDYESGLEANELQERYGLSRGSVQRLVRESGVTKHRRSLTAEERAEVARQYESGQTIREVATAMGVPKTTVQGALARLGVPMRDAARSRRAR
jgi:hypothetical protein